MHCAVLGVLRVAGSLHGIDERREELRRGIELFQFDVYSRKPATADEAPRRFCAQLAGETRAYAFKGGPGVFELSRRLECQTQLHLGD